MQNENEKNKTYERYFDEKYSKQALDTISKKISMLK